MPTWRARVPETDLAQAVSLVDGEMSPDGRDSERKAERAEKGEDVHECGAEGPECLTEELGVESLDVLILVVSLEVSCTTSARLAWIWQTGGSVGTPTTRTGTQHAPDCSDDAL